MCAETHDLPDFYTYPMNEINGYTPPNRRRDGHTATGVAPVYSLNMNKVSVLFDKVQLPRWLSIIAKCWKAVCLIKRVHPSLPFDR